MKLDRLPRRITGLNDQLEPPPSVDAIAFKRSCYLVAQMDGGSVEDIDSDLSGRSYYAATLRTSIDHVSVLCHSVYPFVAFVLPGCFGLRCPDLTFVAPVRLAAAFSALTEFQPLDIEWLATDLRPELLVDLAPVELEQVKYWKPQRIGELIFNYWD